MAWPLLHQSLKVDAAANKPAGFRIGAPLRLVSSDPSAATPVAADFFVALSQREPWAVDALVSEYGPMIRRVIGRLIGSDPELLDLVQETFFQVITNIESLKDETAFRGWVMTIAANRARNRLRSKRRGLLDFWGDNNDLEPCAWIAEGPDQDAESVAVQEQLHGLLNRLPEDERCMLIFRHFEELSWADVAMACEVSEATAKRKVQRGIERLIKLAPNFPAVFERIEALRGGDGN